MAEIFIAILLGIILIVFSIYLTLGYVNNYKKIKARVEGGEPFEKIDEKHVKIVSIVIGVYLAFAIFAFTTKVVSVTMPVVNNQYYVSIATNSMSGKLSSNTYLEENDIKNGLFQYDIAAFDKLGDKEIKLYDIILFKQDNKLITHRVIELVGENQYKTQGDNNVLPDEWTVDRNNVLGIYNHTLKFMSFVNYISYTPGYYVTLVGIAYYIGATLTYEIKLEKLKKQ